MFKKISEAYAVLSNPERRKKYDIYGTIGEDDDDIFDGMFGDIFGNMGGADDFESFMNILE